MKNSYPLELIVLRILYLLKEGKCNKNVKLWGSADEQNHCMLIVVLHKTPFFIDLGFFWKPGATLLRKHFTHVPVIFFSSPPPPMPGFPLSYKLNWRVLAKTKFKMCAHI